MTETMGVPFLDAGGFENLRVNLPPVLCQVLQIGLRQSRHRVVGGGCHIDRDRPERTVAVNQLGLPERASPNLFQTTAPLLWAWMAAAASRRLGSVTTATPSCNERPMMRAPLARNWIVYGVLGPDETRCVVSGYWTRSCLPLADALSVFVFDKL